MHLAGLNLIYSSLEDRLKSIQKQSILLTDNLQSRLKHLNEVENTFQSFITKINKFKLEFMAEILIQPFQLSLSYQELLNKESKYISVHKSNASLDQNQHSVHKKAQTHLKKLPKIGLQPQLSSIDWENTFNKLSQEINDNLLQLNKTKNALISNEIQNRLEKTFVDTPKLHLKLKNNPKIHTKPFIAYSEPITFNNILCVCVDKNKQEYLNIMILKQNKLIQIHKIEYRNWDDQNIQIHHVKQSNFYTLKIGNDLTIFRLNKTKFQYIKKLKSVLSMAVNLKKGIIYWAGENDDDEQYVEVSSLYTNQVFQVIPMKKFCKNIKEGVLLKLDYSHERNQLAVFDGGILCFYQISAKGKIMGIQSEQRVHPTDYFHSPRLFFTQDDLIAINERFDDLNDETTLEIYNIYESEGKQKQVMISITYRYCMFYSVTLSKDKNWALVVDSDNYHMINVKTGETRNRSYPILGLFSNALLQINLDSTTKLQDCKSGYKRIPKDRYDDIEED